MTKLTHPSSLLQPEWINVIRTAAPVADQSGILTPGQLELIYEQQWFKLLVPVVYGGLERSLPELIQLEESLAWADGSTGWVITLCCGAGWFGGFLNAELAKQIFSGRDVCLAGSGASTGTASITNNGYLINGIWKYASGAHHATHFTANCMIKRGEETVLDTNRNPLILPFIIDSKDVKLIPAWKYVGMMGTGSHAFTIDNLLVGQDRCFKIEASATVIDTELYNYPFLQLAEATLAANLSGMAVHFIDLCEPVFEERIKTKKLTTAQKQVLETELNTAKQYLNHARAELYTAVDASWNLPTDSELLKRVSHTSRQLAKIARQCVDQLYPYCGLIAASPDTEINQVWRDFHTASQHSLLTFAE